MNVSVSIRVRNPEWYWTKEELAKSKKKGEMSREEWELHMEDKISKHSSTVDFEYAFDVVSHNDNRNTSFPLTIFSEEETTGNLIPHEVVLENMTVIEFVGEKDKSYVAIANELIHQYLGVKQKKGRFYRYFYLKENVDCFSLSDNIWISQNQLDKLDFTPCGINADKNLVVKNFGMLLDAYGF